MLNKSLELVLLILVGCSDLLLPAHSFVVDRSALCTNTKHCQHRWHTTSTSTSTADKRKVVFRAAQRNNPEDNNEQQKLNNKEEDDDDEDPVEVFLAMEEASKRTTSRLMLPRMIATSISQSVTYAAYAFLIFCFALNVAGYSLINDGKGTLSIGTFEERAFQIEVAKSAREN
mmetsp:Transcript_2328/g.4695  ORF Transcript_2328/g.4695 Transcript_2328/m.4695 type:complete len:173 (-) Transcript_2328:35-553(-)